jgi:poly(A) polymerase
VTVVSGRLPHEVTTFRADVETDGRHAQVAFGQSLEADARRRDFTMNALYAEADGTVIDPLGGLPDLLARRVRFIGDPAERIREDRLRILRFFRFQARYGDPAHGPDEAGLAACAEASDTIQALSRERVGAEMLKLLAAPDPAPALAAMQAAGILAATLPGADASPMAGLVHVEALCGAAPEALRRLALIGGAEPAYRLRLSKADRRRLEALRAAATGSMPAAELGYRLGHDDGRDALLIRSALQAVAPSERDLADIARGAAAEFPVEAADLMPDYTGAALGKRLREMEARWIASGFALGRGDLL